MVEHRVNFLNGPKVISDGPVDCRIARLSKILNLCFYGVDHMTGYP